jgi:glucose/arabinose dehydrogenase
MKKFFAVAALVGGFSCASVFAQATAPAATPPAAQAEAPKTPPMPLIALPAAPTVAPPPAPTPPAVQPQVITPQPSAIITLKDGTKLEVESDNTVWVLGADGSKVTAPDGMMLMRNGLTLVVKNGKQVPYE